MDANEGWIEDKIRARLYLADCYQRVGSVEKSLESLVLSMKYDVPRPEAACRIGDIFKQRGDYAKAIGWYQLALHDENKDNYGFVQQDYSTWYPRVQLCVCYWAIGNVERSLFYHREAKSLRPNNPFVKKNDAFFKLFDGEL